MRKQAAIRDEVLNFIAAGFDPTGMSNGVGNSKAIFVDDAPPPQQDKGMGK